MTVVRVSNETVEDGRRIVGSYHQKAEKLTEQQRKGAIEVSEIPPRPQKPGYKYRLVIDEEHNLGWLEVKVDTPEKELLMRMVQQGKLTLEDLDDEEIRQEIGARVS